MPDVVVVVSMGLFFAFPNPPLPLADSCCISGCVSSGGNLGFTNSEFLQLPETSLGRDFGIYE